MQKAVRAIFGTTLVVVAVAACNDDPLSEGRDEAVFFQLNPSVVTVNAGGTAKAAAVIVNRYGSSTFSQVSAEPCDAKITAAKDTARTDYQPPERFVLTAGSTTGTSCLVVRSEGVSDTITVRIVPASLQIVGDTVVVSGTQMTYTFRALSAAGQPVTGFDATTVRYASLATGSGVVDSLSGNFSARAHGPAQIEVRSRYMNVLRADTIDVRIAPAAFDGTMSASPAEGSVMTITAGAVPFDSDTQVLFAGSDWPWVLGRTATTLTLVTPPTGNVILRNLGPDQLSMSATIPVVSREPADNSIATQRVLNLGPSSSDSMWLSLVAEDKDFVRLNGPAAGGLYIVSLDWAPDAPVRNVDLTVHDATGAPISNAEIDACATAARPETCTFALPAGTWYLAANLTAGDSTTAKLSIAEGSFTGTVAQSAGRGGQILTFTEGTIPFDANTRIKVTGAVDSVTFLELDTIANTVVVAIPFGTEAGTELKYIFTGLGPNNVQAAGAFTTTAANTNDTWTGTDDPATAPAVTVNQAFVGQIGATGADELYKVTVTEAGTYRLQVDWDNGSDIDVYVTDAAYTMNLLARETGANPEVGTVTLQPGTYLIELYMWESVAATTVFRVRFTKQ